MNLELTGKNAGRTLRYPNFNVLFTDYDYAIVYSCSEYEEDRDGDSQEEMFIYARDPAVEETKLNELYDIARTALSFPYDFAKLNEVTDNTGCDALRSSSIKTSASVALLAASLYFGAI